MKNIVIIGAGDVGAHIVSAGISSGLEATFYLVDLNKDLTKSQVLDLKDSQLPSGKTLVEYADFSSAHLQDADIVVITAGVKQHPEESRLELLERNVQVITSIHNSLPSLKSDAIVLMVTNPVDILTQVAVDLFDLPPGQVFGTGTLLDSSRLHWRLAQQAGVPLEESQGYVLGEHGDSGFVAWSTVNLDPGSRTSEIEDEVRQSASMIIDGKGSTYFGIGSAVVRILRSLIHNSKKVLPVSVTLTGQYGIDGIALGVPAIVGSSGIESVVEIPLTDEEIEQLHYSATTLKTQYHQCHHHA